MSCTLDDDPLQTEFYFLRHAETETNQDKSKICGLSPWAELTPKGKEQAGAVGRRLKGVKFHAYYTSDVIRTQQTARYCFEAMGILHQNIVRDGAIIELSQGDWEGQPRIEIYQRPEVKAALLEDPWNFIPGDKIKGESQHMVAERMLSWMKTKISEHPRQRILVITHGLAIKFLYAELFDKDRSTAFEIPIDNTSITIIRYHEGTFSCPLMNCVSHLDD